MSVGQFYTTNWEYILQGMHSDDLCGMSVIEPFAGKGELTRFCGFSELYDIDPKIEGIVKRDTLIDIPDYNGKYVITNPPYLARNKAKDKSIFDKYKSNDLYKCFILSILGRGLLGGIIILPVSFLSSIRKSDIELRKKFVQEFRIVRINLFEDKVFNDTTTSICSVKFVKENGVNVMFPIHVYPDNIEISAYYGENNSYIIGGEIYNLCGSYKVVRLIEGDIPNSNIYVNCLDSSKNTISASIVSEVFFDRTQKKSERSKASLNIFPEIDIETQTVVVMKFNEILSEYRKKYRSLFLNSYREYARKRISFDLVYNLISYSCDLITKTLSHDKSNNSANLVSE